MISLLARFMYYLARLVYVLHCLLQFQPLSHCARCGNSNEYVSYHEPICNHSWCVDVFGCYLSAVFVIRYRVYPGPCHCKCSILCSSGILFRVESVYAYAILPDLQTDNRRRVRNDYRSRYGRRALRPFLVCLPARAERTDCCVAA